MKLYLFFLLCSLNLISQEVVNESYSSYSVEAYYNNKTIEPLYVYDSIHGQVVAAFKNQNAPSSIYKITIIDSEYGWFKIKSIQQINNSGQQTDYQNHWVKASNFLIPIENLIDDKIIYLYDEPNNQANKIHKIDQINYVNILETNNLWVLVHLKIGKRVINGWLNLKNCTNLND